MFSKYDRKDSVQSIYCYEGVEVYKNKLNIRDNELLSKIETDLTSNRLLEMSEKPIKGRFGVTHFLKIHKYIFQDIFSFAGKIREEDIHKGNTFFCKCNHIKSVLNDFFLKLKSEEYLENCDEKDIVSRLSYYMSELNMIHPFREGNGRTIREFIRILALKNGYIINWEHVDSKMLLDAIIQSVDFQYDLLEECIKNALKE
jgi:cell filamentation protein